MSTLGPENKTRNTDPGAQGAHQPAGRVGMSQSHTMMWTAAQGVVGSPHGGEHREIHHIPVHKSELRCKRQSLESGECPEHANLAEDWGLESHVGGKTTSEGFKPQSSV